MLSTLKLDPSELVQLSGGLNSPPDQAGRRTVDPQQRDRVPARRRALAQAMVEHQAIRPDVIPEVVGVIPFRHQVNELTIVRCREDDMRLGRGHQFLENSLACRDALNAVGPSEQLVQQKEMRNRTGARLHQLEERFDLDDVVAAAGEEIV